MAGGDTVAKIIIKSIKVQRAGSGLAPPRENREYSTSRRRLRLSALSPQMASQLAPSPRGLPEPAALCLSAGLSVYRGEPSHTAHSRGNFHLRSCPSGKETEELESLTRSVVHSNGMICTCGAAASPACVIICCGLYIYTQTRWYSRAPPVDFLFFFVSFSNGSSLMLWLWIRCCCYW